MILIDTSVLIYKNLFSSLKYAVTDDNTPIKKYNKKYRLQDYKNLFLHKFITDLRYIYTANKNKYTEMVLCLDDHSASNWKKTFYPEYKLKRKKARDDSPVDFKEFFEFLNEILDNIKKTFPFKIISVPKCEADEVIGILTTKFKETRNILIVSNDKDFKQLFKFKNVKIYNPLKLRMEPILNSEALLEWRMTHIMQGDVADNVPKVVADTEFSPDFIRFLNKNDIYVTDVAEFNKLSISDKLRNEFLEQYPNKNIFKTVRFGPVAQKKFLINFEENMNKNPIYWENFKRNEKLVLFEHIPVELQEEIITIYNNAETSFSIGNVMQFFMKNNLIDLYSNYQDFLPPTGGISSKSVIQNPNSEVKQSVEESLLDSLDSW